MAKSKAELFFAFAGERAGREWENFEKIATNLQQHERFYQIDAELAQDFSGHRETQSIRVYKDSSSFKFEGKGLFLSSYLYLGPDSAKFLI